jgi:hypothetical protein
MYWIKKYVKLNKEEIIAYFATSIKERKCQSIETYLSLSLSLSLYIYIYICIYIYKVTHKTGTFEMRSGSHVQLAALRNRDLELQTTSPFSNHGSVERWTACCRHKNVLHAWISSIFVGFSKVPVFFIHLIYNDKFIWLYVSTCNESSSGHLNLLLWPTSYYKWNVSSLRNPIRLYNGYTDRTYFKIRVIC